MPGTKNGPTARQAKPAKAKKYGVATRAATTLELELPSIDPETNEHNVCLVRRPGPMDLVAAGLLDHYDSLSAMVKIEHFDRVDEKGSGTTKEGEEAVLDQLKGLAENKDALKGMLSMLDQLVVIAVVAPKVALQPTDEEERIPGVLYADEVDLEDRLAILNFAMGGTKQAEPFRT